MTEKGRAMKHIRKIGFTLLAVLLLTGCTGSGTLELDESFLVPLKIGALEYDAEKKTGSLVYLQPGEKIITQLGCGYEDMDTVNINLHFAYEGGSCTVTSPDKDI